MLVLKMKIGWTLTVGPVVIRFYSRQGNWVKIGIDCPKFFNISREPDPSLETDPPID